MEYIDREAAIEAISKLEFVAMDVIAADSINGAFQIVTRYMDKQLRKLPAADVRPVVRGKWIDHYEPYSTGEEWIEAQYGYECSICGRWEYEKEPFCNCGAEMEES